MMNTEVEPREEAARSDKVSPADRLVSNLEGTYYKLTEAAKIVGVSPTTLRRLMKLPNTGVKAPSFQIVQGEMLVYLFTEDDIAELKRHFGLQQPQKRLA